MMKTFAELSNFEMFTSGQIYHKKNISYVCYLFTD